MKAESKLFPYKIQAQCQSAIGVLKRTNDNLLLTKEKVAAFVNDKEMKSVSFGELKKQCGNYLDIIDLLIDANEQDIADFQILDEAVGTDNLIGSIILSNQEKYMQMRDNMEQSAEKYRSMAACSLSPTFCEYYLQIASFYQEMGEQYNEEFLFWIAREELYDSIETTTSGLFTTSAANKSIISICLSNVQQTFELGTDYNPNISCVSAFIDEKIIKEDLNVESGLKLLDEYLIQLGNFSIKERAVLLYEIYENEQERLCSLPNITSIAGTEAGIVNMKAMIDKYKSLRICFNEELYEKSKIYRRTADYIKEIESSYKGERLEEILVAYNKNYDVYLDISKSTNVPTEVIAAIHYREAEKDFINGTCNVYLQNGQELGKETTIVPIGIYYDNFEEASIATFQTDYMKGKIDELELMSNSKDLTAMVTLSILHNGWGNNNGKTSYGYAGTNIYEGGAYTVDGEFDESAVDKRLGTYVIIKYLLENG